MKLKFVTLTGADNRTDAAGMAALVMLRFGSIWKAI